MLSDGWDDWESVDRKGYKNKPSETGNQYLPYENQYGGSYQEAEDYDATDNFVQEDYELEDPFDKLESLEATKTMGLLLENDFRLYESHFNYQNITKEQRNKSCKEDEEQKRSFVYYSEGYEANVDQADDLELSRWQSFFHHIQVVGEGYEDPRNFQNPQIIQTNAPYFENSCNGIADSSQEEEIIECHSSNTANRSLANPLVRETMNKIWPEVVECLEPLVMKCLQYAEAHNVPNTVEDLFADRMQVEEQDKEDFWD